MIGHAHHRLPDTDCDDIFTIDTGNCAIFLSASRTRGGNPAKGEQTWLEQNGVSCAAGTSSRRRDSTGLCSSSCLAYFIYPSTGSRDPTVQSVGEHSSRQQEQASRGNDMTIDQILTKTLADVAATEEAGIKARKTHLRNSPEYHTCQTCKYYSSRISRNVCALDGASIQPTTRCRAWEPRDRDEETD